VVASFPSAAVTTGVDVSVVGSAPESEEPVHPAIQEIATSSTISPDKRAADLQKCLSDIAITHAGFGQHHILIFLKLFEVVFKPSHFYLGEQNISGILSRRVHERQNLNIPGVKRTPGQRMPRAEWRGKVLAESGDVRMVEGNVYFPPESVRFEYLKESHTRTTCHWKGEAQYYNVVVEGEENRDAAWYYPDPKPAAKEIRNYVAFWKGIKVTD